jgi:seryl-tRNA(Sec) selenium transferase
VPPRRRRPVVDSPAADAFVRDVDDGALELDPVVLRALTAALDQWLRDVAGRDTAVERAKVATDYIELLTAARRRMAAERTRHVAELKATTTMSNAQIGRELGVVGNAVKQAHDEARGRPRR